MRVRSCVRGTPLQRVDERTRMSVAYHRSSSGEERLQMTHCRRRLAQRRSAVAHAHAPAAGSARSGTGR